MKYDGLRTIPAKGTYLALVLTTCFSNPVLAQEPEAGAALSSAVRDLSGILMSVIMAALVIAVIVYCLIEFIKLPLRWFFNSLVFMSWKNARYRRFNYQPPNSSVYSTIGMGGAQLFLSSDLFVKRLENQARAAMEEAHDPAVLALFAAGAARDDMELVLKGPYNREGVDDRFAAAQANVAAAIERNLDELQITMTFWWPWVFQTTAIIASIIIVLAFADMIGSLRRALVLLIFIAVAGAYLASIFRDIVGIVRRFGGR